MSPTDRGTDPLDADTDNDNLLDGVENNTGTYVSPAQTGTSPLERDTDSDGFTDGDEVLLGFNPNQSASKPAIPATYAVAVEADQPVHWLRFEETTTASGAVNQGSSAPSFFVSHFRVRSKMGASTSRASMALSMLTVVMSRSGGCSCMSQRVSISAPSCEGNW